MSVRCVALCSGGLDSLLSLALMVRQGVEVVAFHGSNVFHDKAEDPEHLSALRQRLLDLGATDVVFRDLTEAMIAFTKNPRFGYGKNLNACMDCRILAIRTAKGIMDEVGASFLVTGEVIGQRPMSQRRDAMNIVAREVSDLGLEGLLVRPLCAKLLEPTIPEEKGWINRDDLCDFQGRTRKPQMALAAEWGIMDYPSPAGGCLLTDPGFCFRMRDLMEQDPEWTAEDVRLLRVGKHFRVGPGCKIVVSRNEEEGNRLKTLARPDETLAITKDRPGAIVLVRGEATPEVVRMAAGLAVYHSKFRSAGEATVRVWLGSETSDEGDTLSGVVSVAPAELRDLYIGVWQDS